MATLTKKKVTLVTTINGEVLPKTKCIKIKDIYYKIGKVNEKDSGDCFKVTDINGVTKYVSLYKGSVIWDNSLKKYVHKSVYQKIIGIIGPDMKEGYLEDTSQIVVGFVQSRFGKTIFKNEQVALDNNFMEKLSDGYFYDKNAYPKGFFTEKPVPSREYKTALEYGCQNYLRMAEINHKKLFSNNKTSTLVEDIYETNKKLFDNYTFGIEFETTKGLVPDSICKRLGMMPLRDGSISGIEYATIPLTGKEGLYNLGLILDELNKRTVSDLSCSMHVHVGGFERNEENVLALFKMMYTLQEEIYDMFPMYKRKNMGVKRMDYTAPLPSKIMNQMLYKTTITEQVKEDLFPLIYFLSGNASGYENVYLSDIKEHPYNPTNNRKWNMSSRYLWFNLIPLIFTNKQTAEFRIYGMPDKHDKMFNFLIMSLALVDFTIKNSHRIISEPEFREKHNLHNIFYNTFKNLRFLQWHKDRIYNVMKLNIDRGLVYDEKDIK